MDTRACEKGNDNQRLQIPQTAVRERDANVRQRTNEELNLSLHLVDPRHHVKNLATPRKLLSKSAQHQLVVARRHLRVDLEPSRRRCGQQTHGADADGTHVESARDGRGGEREHVNVGRHALDLLFLLHSKTLFLVHYEQTELLELNLVAEQGMRADRHLHERPGADALDVRPHLLKLLGRAPNETREKLDAHARHPLVQHAQMLRSEDRGWRQKRNLAAVSNCAIDGTHRHLSFAETNVATDEPIHRLVALDHVTADGLEASELVGRGLIDEALLEGGIVAIRRLLVRRARRSAQRLALCVHFE